MKEVRQTTINAIRILSAEAIQKPIRATPDSPSGLRPSPIRFGRISSNSTARIPSGTTETALSSPRDTVPCWIILSSISTASASPKRI